jgi:membrane-associated phospholipid phosphatase
MPSGHSSGAFSGMALANRNLDYIEMNRYARTGVKAANVALATSVAWARVEGEKHFPTDVLVGAALGNFTTRFLYEAFIGTKPDDRFSFYLEPSPSGGKLFLSWDF